MIMKADSRPHEILSWIMLDVNEQGQRPLTRINAGLTLSRADLLEKFHCSESIGWILQMS